MRTAGPATGRRGVTEVRRPVDGGCPDPEVLAAFIDGQAGVEERGPIQAHLLACERCADLVAEVAEVVEAGVAADSTHAGPARRVGRRQALVAGAGMLALAAILVLAIRPRGSDVDPGLADPAGGGEQLPVGGGASTPPGAHRRPDRSEPEATREPGRDRPRLTYRVDKIREPGVDVCLLYTSPSPRDLSTSRMPSSA